ncbi:CHASE2 domain-containing protein [Hyalangium rubrum]|uniref:Adenylate/guanylate cyclase domain-containing protein n=1 Tax=Hyalangium rubrum TaxID=3103134 RepID=A0ABU5GZ91_9BACT|nr:adenylate/guanylate cyclase domain-containing protein [Hyalangium sp. s54d21]MDY7225160.1 adenylate/guanylate cyclase domain-containing protein [Hyalangium sp. s54d21]
MKTFLSRHRFEVLALGLASLFCALHAWVERSPSVGLQVGSGSGDNVILRSLHIFEGRATDLQFRIRGVRPPHPDVVVVAVDEKSVQDFGRWPWPRQHVARALDQLREAGVGAVGLDMTFTDEVRDERADAFADALETLDSALAQTSEPSPALLALREELKGRSVDSGDAALAAALARTPQVVQGVIVYPDTDLEQFALQAQEREPMLAGHLVRQFPGSVPGSLHEVDPDTLRVWRGHSIQVPLPAFVQAGKRLGHFNFAPDFDGAVRRVPVFALLEGPRGLLPMLELQTAAAYFGAEVQPEYDADLRQLTGARLRRPDGSLLPLYVPVPINDPFIPVNYPGPAKVFPTLSLSDVVEGRFDPAAVRGKAVLVGVTLVGNFDQRVTPFSELEPGVYVHAAFLSNILSQDFLTRPLAALPLEMLFMLGAALLLARLLPRVRFAWKLGAMVLLGAGWLAVDQLLFSRGIQVATVLPLLSLVASVFGVVFLGYFSVDAEKQRLRETFQHYLDASVMEQVIEHPEKLKLGGERKELTVLFSDIRGFTTLSESLSPEQLVGFVNEYLTPMTDVVFENGGTLDKYIGDAIMAFWGAPVDQPDHALRACSAALGFLERLGEMRGRWRKAGLPEVDIGVGINSGPMNVGHMGTANRFNYTVMGDAVNLGSRLEGLNKTYDTRIIISAGTYAQVQGHVTARRLGVVRVVGKSAVTDIYELRALGRPTGINARAIQVFEAGVAHFIGRDFTAAEASFREVLTLWPEDGPSLRYLEELNTLRWKRPGPEWDGVFTATTK